jgi:hypothetical protein
MGKKKLYDRRSVDGWTMLCKLFIFITSIAHAYSNGFNNADWFDHLTALLTILSFYYLSSRMDNINDHIWNLEGTIDYYERRYGPIEDD